MRQVKWGSVATAGVVLGLGASIQARAAVIGLDGRNAPTGASLLSIGSRFDSFRSVIASMGHAVQSKTSFTSANLAGLDVLIVKQAGIHPYSDAEITAIHSFVAAGHGLIVLGEGGGDTNNTVDNINTLVAPYGVTYATLPSENSGWIITGLNAHPLTAGVSTIGTSYQRQLATIASPAVDLTTGSGADNAIAVVDGINSGNVVLLSDASLWADADSGSHYPIDFADNERLLRNAVAFVSVPEPSAVLVAGMGTLVLMAARQRPSSRSRSTRCC